MEDKKRNIWPWGWSHRDTVWLLVLVVTAAVLFIAFTWSGTNAATYLSFASTVLSIILAVIAIFYTMIQASESNQVMSLLREKLDKVSQDTGTLIKVLPSGDRAATLEAQVTKPVTPPRAYGDESDASSGAEPLATINRILADGIAQLAPTEKPLVNQAELFVALLESKLTPLSAFQVLTLYRSLGILVHSDEYAERHLLVNRDKLTQLMRPEAETKPRLFAP